MKFFSAFAGIGGFDLGIKQAIPDAECVGYSETDKYAIEIYERHFTDIINYGDITRIEPTALPDFDIFCGGFPCQDLSIAGKRAGLCGARSGLFFDIIRVIREKQPQLVFLENVAGLFSSNKGWDFARIVIELDEVGYDVEWQCLNSKNFGVPQNRERVFIIGHLRGTSGGKIFPIGEECGEVPEKTNGECICDGSTTLIACDSGNGRKTQLRSENIAPLRANTGASSNNILFVPDIAGCLTGGGHSGGLHSDMTTLITHNKMRRLTPIECERLQGYPDNWTAGVSDTQRYKCLGNAVTVNVIKAIAKRIGELTANIIPIEAWLSDKEEVLA